MISDNFKKGIAGVALAGTLGGGAIVVDKAVVTDKEVHASINLAITQGKIPQIDVQKVGFDRVAKAYVQIAEEYGVDLTPAEKEENLYDKIREQKKGRGEKIEIKNNAVLTVQ